jgi:hypothetical protein
VSPESSGSARAASEPDAVEGRLTALVELVEQLRATTGAEAIQLRARLLATERRLEALEENGGGDEPAGGTDTPNNKRASGEGTGSSEPGATRTKGPGPKAKTKAGLPQEELVAIRTTKRERRARAGKKRGGGD